MKRRKSFLTLTLAASAFHAVSGGICQFSHSHAGPGP